MFAAPKATPPLSVMLSDLGKPHAAKIAKFLGVHERTVYGWQAQDHAPRAVLLALFWETSWGRGWNNVNAENAARFAAMRVSALESEVDRLRGRVAYLERLAVYDSANAPTFTPSPMWPGNQVRFISSAATASANRLTS